MKATFLSVLVLCSLFTKAQTYSISPAKTVTFTAVLNDITINDIFQVNTGNTKILLKWESVSINLPPLWGYSMCDFGQCYPGIPAGPNTMDSVAVGGQGLLGLNIDPGNNQGSGVVKVFVYQNGFKPNGDTLTWYVNSGPVGVEEISLNSDVKVFPNPATNKLNINSGAVEIKNAAITDALGREVLNVSLSSHSNVIDVSGLQKGFYLLNLETADKKMFKRIIIE